MTSSNSEWQESYVIWGVMKGKRSPPVAEPETGLQKSDV